MKRVCERCGGDLGPLRKGPTPRYCSTRCRVAAHRARQTVPAPLRTRDRWVMWRPMTKAPVQPTGKAASSTDARTWSSWSRVKTAAHKGYVLGNGIGCIDLDHCLVDGELTPAAAEFLAQLPPTWIEISPSGTGLHIWGRMPEGRGRRYINADGLHIERYSTGRYITVTEREFAGSVRCLADLSNVS
ncbi:bifunctional DNA primase/polymerase [Nocardia australiensis]|uniref:bifunctional DNA primase/polymerase n=1 Tax=Nocardia australiensis TaxID=2887191 RepID=UPI0035575E79